MNMEWISVNDRLPKEDDIVLCYCDGEVFEAVLHVVYTNSVTFKQLHNRIFSANMYSIHATHWMPLPEPPKP